MANKVVIRYQALKYAGHEGPWMSPKFERYEMAQEWLEQSLADDDDEAYGQVEKLWFVVNEEAN